MTEKLPASPEKATTENRNIVSKTYGKHNQQEINDNDILTSLQVMKNLQCIQTSDLSPPLQKLLSITCKQTRYPALKHTAKSKMKIAPKWCPHRNIANQTDSKVSTNQILQPISSLPCRRVIQHPKSYPNIQLQITRPQIAEKSRFFCKFDVHSPGGLRPEIVRQQ